MKEKIEGIGVWAEHRFKSAVESISPAMTVLSTAAVVGALSAVLAILAIREYQR